MPLVPRTPRSQQLRLGLQGARWLKPLTRVLFGHYHDMALAQEFEGWCHKDKMLFLGSGDFIGSLGLQR